MAGPLDTASCREREGERHSWLCDLAMMYVYQRTRGGKVLSGAGFNFLAFWFALLAQLEIPCKSAAAEIHVFVDVFRVDKVVSVSFLSTNSSSLSLSLALQNHPQNF